MANPANNRAVTPWLWVAGIAFLLVLVYALRALTRETVTVHVAPATFQTLTSTLSAQGKIEPIEEFQAHAPGPGVIKKIYVDVGQHVSTGTPLIKMDDAEALARVASARAALSAALLNLHEMQQGGTPEERTRFSTDTNAARSEQQQAQANLAAVQALQARGAASAAEVATAQQRVRSAELNVNTSTSHSTGRFSDADRANAEAHVADTRAALAAAESAYRAANITSPVSGTVYSVPFAAYDFVRGGEEDLLDIADLSRIQVRAYFDEPEIGKLLRGQSVKIIWDAKPDKAWHGHIERTPTTVITYGTRNVGECIITVDDARGDLLPNTNVNVTVTLQQRGNVLSIPREALHTEGPKNYVFRIIGGKLRRTPVEPGLINNTSVQILSGLTPNDTIVLGSTVGGQELGEGLSVKVVQ